MDNDEMKKMNRKMKIYLYLTMFWMYYTKILAPVFILGLIALIVGIFKREFLFAGAVLLVGNVFLALILTVRFFRMHSEHPEFERFRKAVVDGVPAEEIDKMTDEWEGNDFYTARIENYRHEGNECKTIGEAFATYKKHCRAVVTGQETFIVSLALDKKYFFDSGKYYVISFDRMRIINDDVEVHMYFDLLYDPDAMKNTKIRFCTEDYENLDEFFDNVEDYLKTANLMDMAIDQVNIGTDE